jgi:hypothetical protein
LCHPASARTTVSSGRGENTGRATTKKTSDASIHLSPWRIRFRARFGKISYLRLRGERKIKNMANDKIEEESLALLTARLDDLTMEIDQLDQNDSGINVALHLFLFTTRN